MNRTNSPQLRPINRRLGVAATAATASIASLLLPGAADAANIRVRPVNANTVVVNVSDARPARGEQLYLQGHAGSSARLFVVDDRTGRRVALRGQRVAGTKSVSYRLTTFAQDGHVRVLVKGSAPAPSHREGNVVELLVASLEEAGPDPEADSDSDANSHAHSDPHPHPHAHSDPHADPEPTPTPTPEPTPTPTPGPITWAAPITITTGGTYTGNWKSTDPYKPAVTIATSQPVTLENCRLGGKGHMVKSSTTGAKITIRNCTATGENPGVSGMAPGRFLSAENFANINVEKNTLTGTAGIYLLNYQGGGTTGNTVRVVYNKARNIDGRQSTGSGFSTTASRIAQFVQLDKVRHLPGGLIAWNDVVNQPYVSAVEDNINVYLSSGTASSPLMIRDNLIRGAWAVNAATAAYSGGGILVGDGNVATANDAPSYVTATGNTVIDTTNYGIAMAAGHHLAINGNRIVSDGKLPNGTAVTAQNVGMYIWNMNNDPNWGSNTSTGNVIGWLKGSSYNNWWVPNCTSCTGNSTMSGVTATTENTEETNWRNRAASAGVTLGSSLS